MLWEKDDAKQLYLVLKVLFGRSDKLQLAWYNDHQTISNHAYKTKAWLPHSSCKATQIMRGSGPLLWLNLENCESEPYINDVILRIPV